MNSIMKFFVTIFLLLSMVSINGLSYELKNDSPSAPTTVNVLDFGAVGDGQTDDSEAFVNAWKTVCGIQASYVNFRIEGEKTFLLKPMTFQGPCNSSQLHVEILGTLTTSKFKYDWGSVVNWLQFYSIDGLIVNGNGTLDGNGSSWWQDSSKGGVYVGNKGPDALNFDHCSFLNLDHLNIINSPRRHIVIYDVNNANLSNINIASPGDSPNTDGIAIGSSNHIQLQYASIQCGDDCIAFGAGSAYINISNVACGPGHGISIGSLGAKGRTDTVEQIFVRDSTITSTMNGLRIKTWRGGSGYARNILFEGVTMTNVSNPIIIDQQYCPHNVCSLSESSAIQVSEITFNRVNGTSTSKYAIDLSCSRLVACTNLTLYQIDLRPALSGDSISSSCLNAHGKASYSNPPVDCLLS